MPSSKFKCKSRTIDFSQYGEKMAALVKEKAFNAVMKATLSAHALAREYAPAHTGLLRNSIEWHVTGMGMRQKGGANLDAIIYESSLYPYWTPSERTLRKMQKAGLETAIPHELGGQAERYESSRSVHKPSNPNRLEGRLTVGVPYWHLIEYGGYVSDAFTREVLGMRNNERFVQPRPFLRPAMYDARYGKGASSEGYLVKIGSYIYVDAAHKRLPRKQEII